jgi:ribonucleoside-diphosphate reductase alpha chain
MIDGKKRLPLDTNTLRQMVLPACKGLDPAIDPDTLIQETLHNVYDGIPIAEVYKALIMAARAHIEKEPDYQLVAARLLLDTIRTEVLGNPTPDTKMDTEYPKLLLIALQRGVDAGLLNPELLKFDLESLGQALKPDRDFQFNYLGLQTLYDRYFLHIENRRIELPQIFFMRVAMGLALREAEREKRAIEFYNVLSSFDFMSSTPTLFNSGTLRPQLSSCYLSTTPDHLDGIYGLIKENALLSKFAGGLGNDWTSVRALGSHIKGTNGKSQGVVPFLKVVNDTAVAVNQGGKRKGAVCTYLETWHLDIEEFLELRKNTGDDRRRTHDMNTANWTIWSSL